MAALDATRGLAWEDVVAVISGTAEWQVMWAAGEHALLAARIARGESVIKCGYSSVLNVLITATIVCIFEHVHWR